MKGQRQPQNTGAIICYYNQQYIIIEQQKYRNKIQSTNQYLQIDRQSQQVSMIKEIDAKKYKTNSYSAFLGIIDLEGFKFVLLCDQAKITSTTEGLEIFQISSLFFMGYTDQSQLRRRPQRKQIFKKIRQYFIILKTGFYFSYKYNLTQAFKNRNKQVLAQNFTWNIKLMIQLDKYNIDFKWKCPIIQGFAKSFDVFLEGTKLSYLLITRRSNKKGGTRYFDRGLNEEGYVANFCQTQQIIKLDEFFISDLQIRGSIPIFFEQVGLTTSTKINRGYELTHQVYKRHLNKIIKNYKRIFFVNLLSVGKYGEKMLTEQLQTHVKKQLMPNLRYLYYDFHHKVKGGHYEKVDQIIEEIRAFKINLRYYIYDSKKGMVLEEPQGAFRTNCLDCLDRTNFFQAKLALITLQSILKLFKVCNRDLLSEMRDNNQNDFIKNFRNIWADNGDNISYHYTGTGSTHTDITRDGKRGWLGNFKHKYKTITRFYNQNFWDFYKMKLVSLLLGVKDEKQQMSVSKMIKERQNQFTAKQMMQIYIFTWKAPKKLPNSLLLFPNTPKLIVVSIQDLGEEQKWNRLILDSIDKERYMLVEQKTVNSNMLKIFAQKDLIKDISFVQHCKIKFRSYYNTVWSNKCATIIRFNLNTTKLVFIGCQLQKGREIVQNRIKNLKQIHEKAFQIQQVGKQKSNPILQDDVIFVLGNMNTNVSRQMKNEFARFTTPDQTNDLELISKFIQHDESNLIMESLLQYRQYQQPDITFAPTYRYVNGAFDPQHSGWTDRIWYSSQNKISCLRYGTVQQLRQEHVPVVGSYMVQIEKLDSQLKERIVNEIIERETKKFGIVLDDEEAEQVCIKI